MSYIQGWRAALAGAVFAAASLVVVPASQSAPGLALDPDAPPLGACPAGVIPPPGFTDVPLTDVHAPAVACTAWWGLTGGRTPTSFAPAARVTRAQLASFTDRLATAATGSPVSTDGARAFPDTAGSVHADAIDRMAAAGIVRGSADGRFHPGDAVTREQAASMVVRLVDLVIAAELPTGTHRFGDVSGTHAGAVNTLAALGVLSGVSEDRFAPRSVLTRAQMASVLARVLTLAVGTGDADVPLDDDAAVAVSAGLHHSCAVILDGTVRCWGTNSHGELGNGATEDSWAVEVVGLDDVVSVSAASSATCALRRDATVWCWGSNRSGELGTGTSETTSSVPVQVTGIDDAVAVSAGGGTACAVHADTTISCWGSNDFGKLGHGEQAEGSRTPVKVAGLEGAVSVSVGVWGTCATGLAGSLACWGSGMFGERTDGTEIRTAFAPAASVIDEPVISVDVEASATCATTLTGEVLCAGLNTYNRLGERPAGDGVTATDDPRTNHPLPVPGMPAPALGAGIGASHSCALLRDATVACVGRNVSGVLGAQLAPDVDDAPTPVRGVGLPPIASLSVADSHNLALDAQGRVWGWGSRNLGPDGVAGALPQQVRIDLDATPSQ